MLTDQELLDVSRVVPLPDARPDRIPHVVAMVHVPSTTALLNHGYTSVLNVPTPSPADLLVMNAVIAEIAKVHAVFAEHYPLVHQVAHIPQNLRSIVFLQMHLDLQIGVKNTIVQQLALFEELPFVKYCVLRALSEVEIFVRNGVRVVELENVAAPYFVGMGSCPMEELLILYLVSREVRRKFPDLSIGVHVLSCNELEALPIALAVGASFIRSEATMFGGMRPEGQTTNSGNLARFFYLRHTLRGLLLPSSLQTQPWLAHDCHPKIWSDVQKKHTVFPSELLNLETWLHNITFMKLEGVIVTGAETGSDVDEKSLAATRKAVDAVMQWNSKTFSSSSSDLTKKLPRIPVVTGSGLAFDMYRKYADFVIVGTALKVNKYWENDVDEDNVRQVMAGFDSCPA